MKTYSVNIGQHYPAGATPGKDGVNFCIFSRHATAVQLLLYQKPDSSSPFQVIDLDPAANRTFFFWHVLVEGMDGQDKVSYTWKVDDPDNDDPGSRFDPSVELLDPWAKAVTDVLWERNNKNTRSMRAMVLPESDYDWEGDEPLQQSSEKEILYELHVGGYTRHPSSEVAHPDSCLHLKQSGAGGRGSAYHL